MRCRWTTLSVTIMYSMLILAFACTSGDDQKGKTDTALPAIKVLDMQGQEIDFQQFAGSVLVVDFWATWCKPCIQEIPAYNEFYAKYGNSKVRLIGLAMESGDLPTVREFVQKHHIAYPVYLADATAPAAFGGVEGFPKTFVIDRKGRIVKSWLGATPGKIEEIDRLVESLLGSGS